MPPVPRAVTKSGRRIVTVTEQRIVREYKQGYSIEVEVKRGTGTRDQDKLTAFVNGETLEKATEKANEAVEELDKLAERTREIQHGESDE